MKFEYASLALGLMICGAAVRVGAAEAPAVANVPAPLSQAERANIAAANYMQRLLTMSDEQLVRSRQVIEKVEKLSREERSALCKRLAEIRGASTADREKIAAEVLPRFGISAEEFRGGREARPAPAAKEAPVPAPVPPRNPEAAERPSQDAERRNAFRSLLDKHWASLSPDEARKDRERFVAMSRDQRLEYAKELRKKYGLPPEPERRRNQPEGGRQDRPGPAREPAAK